jgi:hypothetical protein
MINLSWLIFKDFSLTLEQKTPTIITDKRPHDLTMITAGNEADITALL